MSEFQTGVVVGAVLALSPFVVGVVLVLVVQRQERNIVKRARKAGM